MVRNRTVPATSSAKKCWLDLAQETRAHEPALLRVIRKDWRAAADRIDQRFCDFGANGRASPTAAEAADSFRDCAVHVLRTMHDDRAFLRSIIHARLESAQAQRVAVVAHVSV